MTGTSSASESSAYSTDDEEDEAYSLDDDDNGEEQDADEEEEENEVEEVEGAGSNQGPVRLIFPCSAWHRSRLTLFCPADRQVSSLLQDFRFARSSLPRNHQGDRVNLGSRRTGPRQERPSARFPLLPQPRLLRQQARRALFFRVRQER
jgi:hypothetical protein